MSPQWQIRRADMYTLVLWGRLCSQNSFYRISFLVRILKLLFAQVMFTIQSKGKQILLTANIDFGRKEILFQVASNQQKSITIHIHDCISPCHYPCAEIVTSAPRYLECLYAHSQYIHTVSLLEYFSNIWVHASK